ncbi:MAG: molybdopterin molybdotransferase MoeA [Opitutae bacterium]|nr:molybdopterin molybdotransferase MoeA [Opitutae bacterium]
MISVDAALHAVLAHARPLDAVALPLAQALGRTLRRDARADLDSPPFDASAMDGYAARRADLAQTLRLIGESSAGRGFAGALGPGECVRILTGAPVPAGVDCVVKQEDTARDGDAVRVLHRDPATFIRRRGENRRAGDLVVPAGTRLGPPELAALASAGVALPEVTRAPRCAHVVTGDELVAPDRTPVGAQIRDSNSTLIAALLAQHGAELVAQRALRDDLDGAAAALAELPPHDMLLISGGASVGDHDIARALLERAGYKLHFHGVDLRPGKPLLFAQRGESLAFALPGNPVSHWVVFHLFLAPLLRFLESGVATPLPRLTGRLGAGGRLPPTDRRHTFWPCRATIVDGHPELTPLALASSGDAAGLVGANALLPLPPAGSSFAPGQTVAFIPCP